MNQTSASRRMGGVLWAAGCGLLYLTAGLLAEKSLALLEGAASLSPAGLARLHWGGLALGTVLAALPVLAAARPILGRILGLRWRWRGAVAPMVLYVGLLFPLSWLSQKLPGDPAGGMLLPADPAARVLAFFQLCIVSAVVEELVFRGAIQGLLAPCGPGFSVLGQAAIFASLHGSPARMAFALPMGLVFGWAASRCHSIWPGAALHLLNNAIVFAGLLAGG